MTRALSPDIRPGIRPDIHLVSGRFGRRVRQELQALGRAPGAPVDISGGKAPPALGPGNRILLLDIFRPDLRPRSRPGWRGPRPGCTR